MAGLFNTPILSASERLANVSAEIRDKINQSARSSNDLRPRTLSVSSMINDDYEYSANFDIAFSDALNADTEKITKLERSRKDDQVYGDDTEYATDQTWDLSNDKIEKENITDPIVFIDPVNMYAKSVDVYLKQDQTNGPAIDERKQLEDIQKTRGVVYPLLNVFTSQIDDIKILYYKLSSTEFLPKLFFVLNNADGTYVHKDIPSQNNTVTTMILASVDGVYKKIALEFKCIDLSINDKNQAEFTCEFKCPELNDARYNGVGEEELTTYELVEKLAHETGMGFQCTENIPLIQDKEKRIIPNEKIPEYLSREIRGGGTEFNHVFDSWIDVYGYITIIDKQWVFDYDIDAENLTIWGITGLQSGSYDLPSQSYRKIHRTLTDLRQGGTQSNIEILEYKRKSELNGLTLMRQSYFNPVNKRLELLDLMPKPLTVDDLNASWMVTNSKIEEMVTITTNFNTVFKRKLNDMWDSNRGQNTLIVTLTYPNLGLQRGTLVSIAHYATSEKEKGDVLNLLRRQIVDDEGEEMANEVISNSVKSKIITDPTAQLIDPTISGLYYISGIEYEYRSDVNIQINQKLYLIKKTEVNKQKNESDPPQLSGDTLKDTTAESTSSTESKPATETKTDKKKQDKQYVYRLKKLLIYKNGKKEIIEIETKTEKKTATDVKTAATGTPATSKPTVSADSSTIVSKGNENATKPVTPTDQNTTSDTTNAVNSEEAKKKREEEEKKMLAAQKEYNAKEIEKMNIDMDPGEFENFDLDADMLGYTPKPMSISRDSAMTEYEMNKIGIINNDNPIALDEFVVVGNAKKRDTSKEISNLITNMYIQSQNQKIQAEIAEFRNKNQI